MSDVKITGLTDNNLHAIRTTLPAEVVDTTATTATFHVDNPVQTVEVVMAGLPTRGHPRASLHAVVRKLRKAVQA